MSLPKRSTSLSTLGLLAAAFTLMIAFTSCSGCDDEAAPAVDADCVDNDGDGFGTGCNAGADCNDFNAAIVTCDCADANFAGCECPVNGMSEVCFDGTPDQLGKGACAAGQRTCESGLWSPCIGQTPPLAEVCDTLDNDCDGSMDEGLPLNSLGTCDPSDGTGGSGGGAGPGRPGGGGIGGSGDWNQPGIGPELVVNPQGGLELSGEAPEFHFMWIANSAEGTVSKVDTRTGQEVGRYYSALHIDITLPLPIIGCDPNDPNRLGNCPSRTAVDLEGNVWVANRAFSGQGSVSKIAHEDCVDKNGNGTIETSKDLNGNGIIDVLTDEFRGEDDECILFTVKVGGLQGIPRALAIDPFGPDRGIGSVWVGIHDEFKYVQLRASDGALLREVDVPHNPYGAIIDRFGVLWSIDVGSTNREIGSPDGLVRIVSETGEVTGPFPVESSTDCAGGYGITLDAADNVWIGGLACETVHRYTPSTGGWLTVDTNQGLVRGVAGDRDGWIYAGISDDSGGSVSRIVRFRHEDGSDMQVYEMPGGGGTIGVGLDPDGKVWAVNEDGSTASSLDVATGAKSSHPVGRNPYTYSDFTGYTLRNFTAPRGNYRHIFAGCAEGPTAIWKNLVWEADAPVGTSTFAFVRVADAVDDLVTATEYGPFETSPTNLTAEGVPDGKFIQVELNLTTDTPGITPTLWAIDAQWECPPVE